MEANVPLKGSEDIFILYFLIDVNVKWLVLGPGRF